jgi:hypothetical protein
VPLWAAHVAAVQRQATEAYRFASAGGGFHAESSAQGLRADLRADGVEVAPITGGWTFHPSARRWGCDTARVDVARAAPSVHGNRATYRRSGLEEWYVNGPRGVEQGFTIPAPPPCRRSGGSGVVIELGGGLRAAVVGKGDEASLDDASGRAVLRYSDLHAVDATGRELASYLVAEAGELSLHVEDREAAYPVTVDPLMWTQQSKLLAQDGWMGDYFGGAVAVRGDTAIVGAWGRASGQGTAYAFVRASDGWLQEAELTASSLGTTDGFGIAVAVDADTAMVGAPGHTSGQGAVFVFVRAGTSWSLSQTLTVTGDGGPDNFGASVAIRGPLAVVGAPGTMSSRGSVYVLVRSGDTWAQEAELTASDGALMDLFGEAVALDPAPFSGTSLDGSTLVVGAPGFATSPSPGRAYVFVRTGGAWSQEGALSAGSGVGVGTSVALSGDTAIVGAPGTASAEGTAFVFVRSGTSWTQEAALVASDAHTPQNYGSSVAVSGDTAIVGADPRSSGQGAAYVVARAGTSWSQQQKLAASDGTIGDRFGNVVATDGATVIVGARQSIAQNGAAYVFTTSGTGGTPAATLDLGCRFTTPGPPGFPHAVGTLAMASLALRRRTTRRNRGRAAHPR